ncbi:hypothetical protein K502DRAFT_366435, partial [Neoconidiobolus thromboides FSU 785]
MTTKFYFITSAVNLFCSIILICHAFNYWINYNSFNAIGVIQGIYCLIFSAFLIGFEVESIQNIYVVYFQFMKFPLGRGLTYLFFSLITLTTTWYGILSLILLIKFGALSIFIHFLIPDSTYYPIIPSLTSNISDYTGDDNPVSTITPTAPEVITVPS